MLVHPLEVAHAEKDNFIVGIDEVGRGAVAGPLVVCACLVPPSILLPTEKDGWFDEIKDSKKIPKKKHVYLAEKIKEVCPYWLVEASSQQIDTVGIGNLNKSLVNEVIERVLSNYVAEACHFLIDYVTPSNKKISYSSFPKADDSCFSVACASILAKNYRDTLMRGFSLEHNHYSWETNSGYGTKHHLSAINTHGLTRLHRRSFLKGQQIAKQL